MPQILLAFAVALIACGDASDTVVHTVPAADLEAVALEAPVDSANTATPPSAPATRVDCQARAAEIARDYGDVLEAVPDHTSAIRTADGDACFVPLYRDVTAAQLAPGEDFPYPYSFVIDRDGETTDLEVADAPLASAIVEVAFEDINGDGTDDIFIVHDGEASSLSFASDTDAPGTWYQLWFDNGEPGGGPFAETAAEVAEAWRDLGDGAP